MPTGWGLLLAFSLAAAAAVAWAVATAYFVALSQGRRARARRRLRAGADRGPLRLFFDEELTWRPRATVRIPKEWPAPERLRRSGAGRASAYAALADNCARVRTLVGELFFLFGGAVAGAGVAIIVGDDADIGASLGPVPPVATACVGTGFVFGAAGYFFRQARTP